MSQKTCPFCKRVIRTKDKFCPFCGEYVLESTAPQGVYPPSGPPQQPPYTPPQGSQPPYTPPQGSQPPYAPPPRTIPVTQPTPSSGAPAAPIKPSAPPPPQEDPGLSEDIIDQIVLRVELAQLDNSMNEIRAKLEELAEQISKIEVTAEIEKRIQNFKDQIKEIKAKREKLNLEKQDLPFEAEMTEKQDVQERLKNLNDAYRAKKVTETAFKKLRGEYEAKLQEIDNKSKEFKAKINAWIKKFKVDESKIQEKLEILEARHAAGELTQSQFDNEKNTITSELNRYTAVIKFLSNQI